LFLLLIIAGAVAWFRPQLARVALARTAAALLAFTLANPDGLIAQHNVDRWRETGKIDLTYLGTLSADAAPALTELPGDLRNRALAPLAARLADAEPWSSANLSRHRARTVLRAGAAVSRPRGPR